MRPLSTQPSPSRRAVVVMLWEFVPASGSVIANAIVAVPSAMPGSHGALLLLGAEPVDDRAADRRADHHHQQRAALRGELLADGRDVADAAAPAAVLLGDVDAEVAVPADLQPQLGGLAAAARLRGEVVAAVAAGQLGHLAAQRDPLVGLGERDLLGHAGSPPRRVGRACRNHCQHLAGGDLGPHRHGQVGDRPVVRGGDGVLHLHGLEDQDGLARGDARRRSRRAGVRRTRASARAANRSPPSRPGPGTAGVRRSATCPSADSTSTRDPWRYTRNRRTTPELSGADVAMTTSPPDNSARRSPLA